MPAIGHVLSSCCNFIVPQQLLSICIYVDETQCRRSAVRAQGYLRGCVHQPNVFFQAGCGQFKGMFEVSKYGSYFLLAPYREEGGLGELVYAMIADDWMLRVVKKFLLAQISNTPDISYHAVCYTYRYGMCAKNCKFSSRTARKYSGRR